MMVETGSVVLKLPEVYESGLQGVATRVERPAGEEQLPPGMAFFLFADVSPIATFGAAQQLFAEIQADLAAGPVGELFSRPYQFDVM